MSEVVPAADRLDSWKEIAAYLNRSVRTVRRWEAQERLPIHRLRHEKGGSVYALKPELDAWRQFREIPEEHPESVIESAQVAFEHQTADEAVQYWPYESAVPVRWPRRIWSAHRGLLAAIFIGGAGIFATVYGVRHSIEEGAPAVVLPLTSYQGNETQPSLSPDGNQVAFAFNGGRPSNYQIYVKAIGSEKLVRLTSNSGDDLTPSWSPDGQNIAFLRFVSEHSASVIVLPSCGGAERSLAKIVISKRVRDIRVSWSPDGKWLATSDAETLLSPMRLILVSATTGEKRKLTYKPPAVEADVSPSFSQDGRYLAFARHISPVVADIFLLRVPENGRSDSEAFQLTHSNRLNSSPVWSSNGREIFFVGEEPSLRPRIWRIPAFDSPSRARVLNEIGEDSSSITLSAQKKRLVYAKESEDFNIWRIASDQAFDSNKSHRPSGSSRLIASTRYDGNPQYSPDGKHIAFQSDRSGYSEIWIANRDGAASRQLTRIQARVSGYPRWSPDGKRIAFHSRPNGFANILTVDVETGDYRQLTTGQFNDRAPSWSRDGKWIYFTSERRNGSQIWRAPSSGGPATQLTDNGGAVAFESIDGRFLLYSKFSEPGLWVLPLAGGIEHQVLPSLYGFSNFAITGKGIYYMRRVAEAKAILSVMDWSARKNQDIQEISSPIGDGLAVSPEANSVLYTQVDHRESDLILVDNFE